MISVLRFWACSGGRVTYRKQSGHGLELYAYFRILSNVVLRLTVVLALFLADSEASLSVRLTDMTDSSSVSWVPLAPSDTPIFLDGKKYG